MIVRRNRRRITNIQFQKKAEKGTRRTQIGKVSLQNTFGQNKFDLSMAMGSLIDCVEVAVESTTQRWTK
jgi:hypothetical protein